MWKNIIIILLIIAAIIAAQFSCASVASASSASSRNKVTTITCTLISSSVTSMEGRDEYRQHVLIDGKEYFVFKSISKISPKTEVVFVRISDMETRIIKDAWSWTQSSDGVPVKGAIMVQFVYK